MKQKEYLVVYYNGVSVCLERKIWAFNFGDAFEIAKKVGKEDTDLSTYRIIKIEDIGAL